MVKETEDYRYNSSRILCVYIELLSSTVRLAVMGGQKNKQAILFDY